MTVITANEKVMLSSAFLLVRLCLSSGLRKKYSTDFHKIRYKDGPRKKALDFGGNPDLMQGYGYS